MHASLPEKVALYAIGISVLRKALMNFVLSGEMVKGGMDK
jgi:hypothetical protein